MPTKQSWRSLLQEVSLDNVSGAHGVIDGAVELILAYVQVQSAEVPYEQIVTDLRKISAELLKAQPAMASVVGFLNELWLLIIGEQGDARELLDGLGTKARNYRSSQRDGISKVAEHGAGLIRDGAHVLTISSSSTVRETLLVAHRRGNTPQVTCLESRPMCEGRVLASQLAAADIPVTVVVDAAMHSQVVAADLVLLGVDSFAPVGVVGKLGSAALSVLALDALVPVYALADGSKLWPASIGDPSIRERPAHEVWSEAPDNLVIGNRYFDVVDWSTLEGVFTDRGREDENALLSACRAITIHPELATLFDVVSDA